MLCFPGLARCGTFSSRAAFPAEQWDTINLIPGSATSHPRPESEAPHLRSGTFSRACPLPWETRRAVLPWLGRTRAPERKASPRMSSRAATQTIGIPPRLLRLSLLSLFLFASLLWLFSRSLLSTKFLPHWYCYVGNTRLLWTNVLADAFIGLSYVAISATLVWIVRRAGRDLPYQGFFWAFGLFIVSCGATHFLEVVTVWKPVYWLSAAVKILTAVSSVGTAVVLLIAAEDIVDFVHTAREAATRRLNERFQALVKAAPLAVLSFDLQGRVTSWNPGAEKI